MRVGNIGFHWLLWLGLHRGYVDRLTFHAIKREKIVPYGRYLDPCLFWIRKNTYVHRIRRDRSFKGCHIAFLPPYSPHLNSIELIFSRLKSWIKRYPHVLRFNIKNIGCCNDVVHY